jgi:hypothetical protein
MIVGVSRRVRLALGASVIAIAAAGIGVAGGAVFAASAHSRASVVQGATTSGAITKETLKATYVEDGDAGATESAETYLPIDPVDTISCPAAKGHTCTVEMTISLEASSPTGHAGNDLAVPWKINGTFTGLDGPWLGETSTDETQSEYVYSDFEHGLTPGNHTVQAFAFSLYGIDIADWSITYEVFLP